MLNYLLKHLDVLIALEFFVTILIIFERSAGRSISDLLL